MHRFLAPPQPRRVTPTHHARREEFLVLALAWMWMFALAGALLVACGPGR